MQCLQCGKELKKRGQRKYCSRSCGGKNSFLTSNQKGSNNKAWIGDFISKDELIELYLNQKFSMNYIANLKKVSHTAIKKRLKIFNISLRTYHEQKKADSLMGRTIESHKHQVIEGSKKRNRKIYLAIAKANFKWECMKCGKLKTNDNFDLIVHHKDRNRFNNDVSNLMVLCQPCHAFIHGKMENHILNTRWK